jgi:NADH-quinone oxidoreductase subunit E
MVPSPAGKMVVKAGITMEATAVSQNTCSCGSLPATELVRQVDEVLANFRREQAELIPVLQQVQQKFGYLPEAALQRIAQYLKVPECTVFGVATFYALFRLAPAGKRIVRVCRGTACHVRGGARILQEVEKGLGIKEGETSADLENSIQTIACFGSCALAPVVVVGEKVYGRMTPAKVEQILSETKAQ